MPKILNMENSNSQNIINSSYQSAKQIVGTIDNFLLDIKNEKFKNICANFVQKFDLIIDECKMLAKAYNSELEETNFFDKYQNIISLKIANLTKKTTFEIAEILYLCVCEELPKLYSFLIFSDLDEISLVKKLISTGEEFVENIKQFFVVSD